MVISVAPAKGRVGLSLRRLLPNADADLSSLVHPSDRGVQYVAIRYTERRAGAGAVGSVGSRGDGYDNALAKLSAASTRASSFAGGDRAPSTVSSRPRAG